MTAPTVISLGGGVQSTVLALMAATGEFEPVPDCAIFADTHWEPPSIYANLEWLATQLPFPLHIVDNGRSLREDVKALINHSGIPNYVDIPVFLRGRDGQGDGIGRRQCTTNYKIRPITKKIRELLEVRPEERSRRATPLNCEGSPSAHYGEAVLTRMASRYRQPLQLVKDREKIISNPRDRERGSIE